MPLYLPLYSLHSCNSSCLMSALPAGLRFGPMLLVIISLMLGFVRGSLIEMPYRKPVTSTAFVVHRRASVVKTSFTDEDELNVEGASIVPIVPETVAPKAHPVPSPASNTCVLSESITSSAPLQSTTCVLWNQCNLFFQVSS